jgi:hypothetical protein
MPDLQQQFLINKAFNSFNQVFNVTALQKALKALAEAK